LNRGGLDAAVIVNAACCREPADRRPALLLYRQRRFLATTTVMHTEGLATNGFRSRDRPANASDFRFRKAVCRVLIALSFKSFRRRNERYRRRERSDCSEARILPIVEEERPSEPELDADNYITAAAVVRPLADDRCASHRRRPLGGHYVLPMFFTYIFYACFITTPFLFLCNSYKCQSI